MRDPMPFKPRMIYHLIGRNLTWAERWRFRVAYAGWAVIPYWIRMAVFMATCVPLYALVCFLEMAAERAGKGLQRVGAFITPEQPPWRISPDDGIPDRARKILARMSLLTDDEG